MIILLPWFDGVVIAAQCTVTFQDLLCSPIYFFPASPMSVANCRNRSTGTCESCWSSPKLCPKMRPHDIVRDSHSHSRCSTVIGYVCSCRPCVKILTSLGGQVCCWNVTFIAQSELLTIGVQITNSPAWATFQRSTRLFLKMLKF